MTPCMSVCPNLKAAVAKALVMVGLTPGSYLLEWAWLGGAMSRRAMVSAPSTRGSHSL